jgi:hypothetical protein
MLFTGMAAKAEGRRFNGYLIALQHTVSAESCKQRQAIKIQIITDSSAVNLYRTNVMTRPSVSLTQ